MTDDVTTLQVDVCDVLDHDDVKITGFVVNDFVVASSRLTNSVTGEVSPIAANKEAIRETNHDDIDPLSGRVVSSEQTQFLELILHFIQRIPPFPLISHI